MKLIALTSLFLTLNAFAIDPSRCPHFIQAEGEITRVYNDSRYSDMIGWKEAQSSLRENPRFEVRLKLSGKTKSTCHYSDRNDNTAVLSTASFQDPDESDPQLVDQLIFKPVLGQSQFVSFIPLKNYSTEGLVFYQNPYSIKIKAVLYVARSTRTVSVDMGQVSVLLK